MYNIIILMYHFFHAVEPKNDPLFINEKRYFIETSLFDQHLKYLKNNSNIEITFFQDLFLDKNRKKIIITFDDGHQSVYTQAYPILKKYQIPATIFMTTDYIDKPHYLTSEQLKELSDDPLISIQSHSVSHPFLNDMNEEEVYLEFSESKKILEKLLNKQINIFALPGGRIPKNINTIAQKSGYKYICTSIPGINHRDQLILKRLDIQRNYNIDRFKQLFASPSTVFKLQLKYNILQAIKRLFGNKLYLKLRKFAQR